jgi:hypothetical protein
MNEPPTTAPSPLDRTVREMLLEYPTLFATRWDALVHLYIVIGNGYEWRPGPDGAELADVCSEPFDETRARARFFRDLDDADARRAQWRAEFGTGLHGEDGDARLARARRQFQLDHLDDLVHERRMNTGRLGLTMETMRQISLTYSAMFTVPDDAEPSFRSGAVEVLRELMPLLHYPASAGTDGGARAAVGKTLYRLEPQATQAMNDLIAFVLGETDHNPADD